MAFEYSRLLSSEFLQGMTDTGTLTACTTISTTYSHQTSGDAFLIRWISPVSQTSGSFTAYLWCIAATGSPTANIQLYNGPTSSDDPDRAEGSGSGLGTQGSNVSLTANTWTTFTLTNVTLVEGQTYWLVCDIKSGTSFTMAERSALDSLGSANDDWMRGADTTSGLTTDPGLSTTGIPPAVFKFDGGELMGNPYVSSRSHSSNTNDRGFRFTPTEDIVVSGIRFPGTSSTTRAFAIYNGASQIASTTLDYYNMQRAGCARFDPVTLTGGTTYDVVVENYSGNSSTGTIFEMDGGVGATVPADVAACLPAPDYARVEGATPGSYTATSDEGIAMCIILDNNPAIAGGGGGGGLKLAGRGGLAG